MHTAPRVNLSYSCCYMHASYLYIVFAPIIIICKYVYSAEKQPNMYDGFKLRTFITCERVTIVHFLDDVIIYIPFSCIV